MIQSTANVSTRSKAKCNIGSKLTVATPILVCTLNVLFDSRPEVIGKLSAFNNHMYFRIETAHSVSRSHNIIFGYRSTEHTGITKLLLHPLGDIEYASFIFIGHVLSPDKGIRIAAKLLFERFINGVHHETLLTFDRPRKSVFILLRNIRFGKDKVINALRNRIGCSQRFTIGGSQFFLGGSFYLLEVLFGQALVAQQHPTELH